MKDSILKNSFITLKEFKTSMELYSSGLEYIEFVKGIQKGRLSQKEKQALIFYMMYGYNEESIQDIKDYTQVDDIYMNTINSNLRSKGYLVKDDRNFHKSHLSDEVKELKEHLDTDGIKMFSIVFKRK